MVWDGRSMSLAVSYDILRSQKCFHATSFQIPTIYSWPAMSNINNDYSICYCSVIKNMEITEIYKDIIIILCLIRPFAGATELDSRCLNLESWCMLPDGVF